MANSPLSFVVVLILIALVALVFFMLDGMGLFPSATIKQLQAVEVRDYNGTKLSSVADFRENSIKGPQYVNMTGYRLSVDGLVSAPQSYTYDDVLGHQAYEKVVTLNCVEGWSATILWQGVLVRDLIAAAKPLPGTTTVIFHAYDGYTTSFPLSYVEDNDIVLAYKMNNVTMPPERGYPFQLVAESKWGYKWIKWVTQIELSNDTNYKGYWESNGYSVSGDLNKSFIGG